MPAIIFELSESSIYSTKLSEKHIKWEYFVATMIHYTKDIPTLHAWEDIRMEQFDQDQFIHEGEWDDFDGSEGAPIFANRSSIADDWDLIALRVNNPQVTGSEE